MYKTLCVVCWVGVGLSVMTWSVAASEGVASHTKSSGYRSVAAKPSIKAYVGMIQSVAQDYEAAMTAANEKVRLELAGRVSHREACGSLGKAEMAWIELDGLTRTLSFENDEDEKVLRNLIRMAKPAFALNCAPTRGTRAQTPGLYGAEFESIGQRSAFLGRTAFVGLNEGKVTLPGT